MFVVSQSSMPAPRPVNLCNKYTKIDPTEVHWPVFFFGHIDSLRGSESTEIRGHWYGKMNEHQLGRHHRHLQVIE